MYSTYKILSNFFVFLKLENYLSGKMKIPKFLSIIFLFPSTKMQIPKEIQIKDDTGDTDTRRYRKYRYKRNVWEFWF